MTLHQFQSAGLAITIDDGRTGLHSFRDHSESQRHTCDCHVVGVDTGDLVIFGLALIARIVCRTNGARKDRPSHGNIGFA
jgi:hypothetical protein